jgi:hypothetical protein
VRQIRPDYFIDKNGDVFSFKNNIERKLKPGITKNGYALVTMSHSGKTKSEYVHRLLAEVYLDNYSPILDVNHIDGNKSNNRIENIEILNRSENLKHAVRIGLVTKRSYLDKRNTRSKMDDCSMLAVLTFKNLSNRELAKKLNCSHHTIKRLKDQASDFGI